MTIDALDQARLDWLRSASSRDVPPVLEHEVERLVREGVAEWMPARVVVVGGRRVKRKRARAVAR